MPKRLTIEEMHPLAEERGGKCLSTEYVNASTHLEWECAHGHRWSATPMGIKNGYWCKICSANRRCQKKLKEYQSLAEERGGKCLSTEYVGSHSKLEWECDNGHPSWWASSSSVKDQGTWCPTCWDTKITIEQMQAIAEERGGKCLSTEYVGCMIKHEWECALGHQWSATPDRVKYGSWCKICSRGIGERICRAYFRQIFGLPFPSTRPKWLKNRRGNQMELDGYCKELGIAFEHQGEQHYKQSLRFHKSKEEFNKRKLDDITKAQLCKDHGIRLVCVPAVFKMTKLEDFQQWLYDECQKIGIDTPDDMLTKKIHLKSTWKNTRTIKALAECHAIAKERGGKCLSTEYLSSISKLEWECAHGHQWSAPPARIKFGFWCRKCADAAQLDTIEEMQAIAEERGGKCLSTEYVNQNTPLEWECAKGHSWSAEPNNVKNSGSWCRTCVRLSKRLTIEQMQAIAQERGGKCLSTEYVGAHSNLEWQCGNGHPPWFASPHSVKNHGSWCKKCSLDRRYNRLNA